MPQYVVTASRVNFRSSAMIADNIITTLNRGQLLDVANPTDGAEWLEATTLVSSQPDDIRGFVSAQFVVEADRPVSQTPTKGSPAITLSQLKTLAPHGKAAFIEPLANQCVNARMSHGLGTSPLHICHFLAQLAHEAAGFITMREFWGPTPAQKRYEGRRDLGNTQSGDGKRFMGRGYLQITGRANYGKYGALIGQPLTSMPQLAEDPVHALNIACLYWKARNIDEPASQNNIAEVTRRINGGHNGLADRTALFKKAMSIWG
jgi:putative chitinase